MAGYTVAILWRGDHQQRRDATPYNNRYRQVFEELMGLGIDAQPQVYNDDIAEEVRAQLLKAGVEGPPELRPHSGAVHFCKLVRYGIVDLIFSTSHSLSLLQTSFSLLQTA